jgi:thiol:disulfide interchange protein
MPQQQPRDSASSSVIRSVPDHIRRPKSSGALLNVLIIIGVVCIGLLVVGGMKLDSKSAGGGTGKGSIQWRSSFGAATAEAKPSGLPILMDFNASWCPPCRMMDEVTWPDEKLAQLVNAHFIPVKVDVDAETDLARKYGVASIPTLLVVRNGQTLWQHTGYMDPGELAEALKAAEK